ncbi:MAG TPA: ubiquinol oxidase subunit II [Candidatus Saccharimonadales bacterium]|nr:ubiquinol oxidase subunit II [Candidatus Saccharimonadales bacterium]
MRAKYKKEVGLTLLFAVILVATIIVVAFFRRHNVAILEPRGTIAHQERNLMLVALLLCAIVVIPVFALTILIALKYREGNTKKKHYSPNWEGGRWMEVTWWGIPFAIIFVLAIITWNSSYNLDPYKALASNNKTMRIQVVSLDWKWLFIYPDQNIATVNYVRFPVNTPVNFEITSDSVMNSFWIPNLGGQIYAMPGMSTDLNLMASKAGAYSGSSANISGQGFSDMDFTATASSKQDFKTWLSSVKKSTASLSENTYSKLAKPSLHNQIAYYSSVKSGLYDQIVDRYMGPMAQMPGMHGEGQ